MGPHQPAEPSLLVLPVISGKVRDFEVMPDRVRDFLRFRQSDVGPWLFDLQQHGRSLWEWVAATGFGDSCRDARILDEFIEMVFAHDPETGTMAVTVMKPSTRSTLTTDSVILNQVLAFIASHLTEPVLASFMRSPGIKGCPSEAGYAASPASMLGGSVAPELEELVTAAYARGLGNAAREQGDRVIVKRVSSQSEIDALLDEHPDARRMPAPSPSLIVPDWLDVLLREVDDNGQLGEYAPPTSAREMKERLARILTSFFQLELPESLEFVMAVSALFARIVERTNTLRRLYRHHAEMWPELPPLSPPRCEMAYVTFCLATPELARLTAELPCEQCEGCAQTSDVTLMDQLALDLAS